MTIDLDGALICVVGQPRSGTHWVQRILATHPDVASVPGETYLFSRGIAPLFERFQHATPASPSLGQVFIEHDVLLEHARALCEAALVPYLTPGIGRPRRLVERTPEHVRHIELIATLYPQTRFVHVIRDPRRVVRSVVDQPWGTDDVAEAADDWRTGVTTGRDHGARVAHYVEVRYEHLRQDPGGVIRQLLEALGLDARDEVVDHAVAEASVVANTRARGPRRPLSRREARTVEQVTGDVLARLEEGPAATRSGGGGDERATRGGTDDDHWIRRSMHHTTRGANRLLEVLRGTRPATEAADLLGPDVALRLVSRGEDRRWRGRSHLPDLLTALADEGTLSHATRWSTQHSCPHLHVVVYHAEEAGGDHDSLVVTRIDRPGITEVVVYGFPLAGRDVREQPERHG